MMKSISEISNTKISFQFLTTPLRTWTNMDRTFPWCWKCCATPHDTWSKLHMSDDAKKIISKHAVHPRLSPICLALTFLELHVPQHWTLFWPFCLFKLKFISDAYVFAYRKHTNIGGVLFILTEGGAWGGAGGVTPMRKLRNVSCHSLWSTTKRWQTKYSYQCWYRNFMHIC